MKIALSVLSILLISCSIAWDRDSSDVNRSRLFNNGWKFIRDSVAGAEDVAFDDSEWLAVDLPHDFSIMDLPGDDSDVQTGAFSRRSQGGNHTGHAIGGTGWYRKTFTLDATDEGKKVFLLFDGAYMETAVWMNGAHIDVHKNGYTPFYFDITDALKPVGKPNVVAVKVDNMGKNSRWYSGSGLYRNVHLIVTAPVYVQPWGVYVTTQEVSTTQAKVKVAVSLRNEGNGTATTLVAINIVNMDGAVVSSNEETLTVKDSLTLEKLIDLEKPSLWSVDSPNMYKAEILLKHNGKIIDAYTQPFGVRSIEFTADRGFLLNGQPVLLKGSCLHHDNGFLGAAAIERAEYRRVALLKQNGFNAVRCAHNPPSEAFLNACDELGMLVIDEFTDMWNLYKNPDDYSRFFNDWWNKDLSDMLLRDRNHPSVIMWSIGNEIPKMNIDEGVSIAKMLKDRVKQLDATRAVTEAVPSFLIHGGWKNTKDFFALLDVCGYNYMQSAYLSDHQLYPDRIIYGSESFPNQAYESWKAVEDNTFVIGDFVWTAMDYIGEVAIGNSKYVKERKTQSFQSMDGIPEGVNPTLVFDMMAKYSTSTWPQYLSWCGDIDIIGEKKPQGLYRDVLWDRSIIEICVHEPMPEGYVEEVSLWGWQRELPTWNWQGNEGKTLQVRVFTKAPKVRLELNGKTLGEKTLQEADKYVTTFEVPYEAGKLTAVAISSDGREQGRRSLTTTGEATAIKVTVDRAVINPDRNDLAFCKIEAIDAAGQVVPTDSSMVEITVSGAGELIASGNADPDGIGSTNKARLNLFRGRAQAIIRPFEEQGTIIITVKSDDLKSAVLEIKCGR